MFKKVILLSSSFIIILLLCLGFTSCSKVMTAEGIKIKSIADPITENYFLSINNQDYDKFSKDFDDGMKKAVTKDNFAQLVLPIKDKLGDYIPNSIKLVTIANEQGFTAAYYNANFSKKNNVKIKMVFSMIGNEYKISGQWFQ